MKLPNLECLLARDEDRSGAPPFRPSYRPWRRFTGAQWVFGVLRVSSNLATPETITSILPHALGLPLDLGLQLAGPHGEHGGAELQDQLQSLPTPNLASAAAAAAPLAMSGTVCNHWIQQIDPHSTVHRRVRHVPRRRGAAVDQLESPRRPGCPRGFQQSAQHGRTAQERRERANRPPDYHSPSALCASTAAEIVPRTCSSRGPSARHTISCTRRDRLDGPRLLRPRGSGFGAAGEHGLRYAAVFVTQLMPLKAFISK